MDGWPPPPGGGLQDFWATGEPTDDTDAQLAALAARLELAQAAAAAPVHAPVGAPHAPHLHAPPEPRLRHFAGARAYPSTSYAGGVPAVPSGGHGYAPPAPYRHDGPVRGHHHHRPPAPLPPPPPTEVNYNKIITKKLASATRFHQVLDTVATSVHMFDEVNVATALHRLAKLQPPAGAAAAAAAAATAAGSLSAAAAPSPAALFASDPFARLVAAAGALLPRFGAQAVSNTLWAFATLGYLPRDDLLDRIARHAAATMGGFRPQATSNTLWAMAKLGHAPPDELFDAAAAQMVADMSTCVPQDISNSLWAYATLRRHPGDPLLDAAAARAVAVAARFKPQEVANTLWSYAALGHDPGPALLDALAAHAAARASAFRPQAVANALWAFARLRYSPGAAVLDAVAAHVGAGLHAYTAAELATSLWALASLEFYPGAGLLDGAAGAAAARLDAYAPADAARVVGAYARLFHAPPGGLLRRAADHATRCWRRYKPAEAAGVVWALALLRGAPPSAWAALHAHLATLDPDALDDADLELLYGAFLMLGGGRPGAPAPSSAAGFPAALAARGERVWRAAARRPAPSRLVGEVAATLTSMGVEARVGGTTPCGLFACDVVIPGRGLLDVDGPSAYAAGSRRPLGRTAARRAAIEATGYALRCVPYFEWDALALDAGGAATPDAADGARRMYLAALLDTMVPIEDDDGGEVEEAAAAAAADGSAGVGSFEDGVFGADGIVEGGADVYGAEEEEGLGKGTAAPL